MKKNVVYKAAMNIQRFSQKIGIDYRHMSRIFGGKGTTTATIRKIAEGLGKDPGGIGKLLLDDPRSVRDMIKALPE